MDGEETDARGTDGGPASVVKQTARQALQSLQHGILLYRVSQVWAQTVTIRRWRALHRCKPKVMRWLKESRDGAVFRAQQREIEQMLRAGNKVAVGNWNYLRVTRK